MQDYARCRSHGHKSLCDGFVCDIGKECASGCCGSFANLREDFCLPQQDERCISHGFHYGPYGLDFNVPQETPWQMVTPEPLNPGEDHPYDFEQEKDNLPGTIQVPVAEDVGPDGEKKKESAFYFGVIAGIAIWIIVITLCIIAYCLCRKRSPSVDAQAQEGMPESNANYHNLPEQREQNSL